MGEAVELDRRSASDRRAEPRDTGRRSGDYVSVTWLAAFWDVHPNTIYRDIRKGALRACRLPSGQFRVLLADARRYGRPVE